MGYRIKFTNIPNKLNYKLEYKGILSLYHYDIIDYVIHHFQDSRKFKIATILLMNQVSYLVYSGDAFPTNWSSKNNPFEPEGFWKRIYVDNKTSLIKDIFIDYMDVDWDIQETNTSERSQERSQYNSSFAVDNVNKLNIVTKDDLSIQPPVYPRFDMTKIWKSGIINDTTYCVYASLPEIPTIQREISVTTDVNKMTDFDLIRLFPKSTIFTRYTALYTYTDNIMYDDILGCITPVQGFTTQDIKDNIIKYPHFYKLKKIVDGEVVNFYNTIEIDGELHKVLDVWDKLPESKIIPKQIDFIKDYVVRRYLLERDVLGIKHKYPIYGTLEPFLTLFMNPADYKKYGYADALWLARACVASRVSYKTSRNPVIKRLEQNV